MVDVGLVGDIRWFVMFCVLLHLLMFGCDGEMIDSLVLSCAQSAHVHSVPAAECYSQLFAAFGNFFFFSNIKILI